MLEKLPHDVIAHILAVLDVRDRCQLDRCCRALTQLEPSYYVELAVGDWGVEFWSRARARRTAVSRPLCCLRAESIRLERFQRAVERTGAVRWPVRLFYKLWDCDAFLPSDRTISGCPSRK